MGKGNGKDEEKKEEEMEKKVSSASLDLSLPEIAGSEDEARESASDALSFVFAEDIEDDGSFSEESMLRRGCSPFQLSTLYFN